MTEFVAHYSRWRLALLFLGCIAFVVLGLWGGGMFGPPPDSRRYPEFLVVGAGWACFVLGAIAAPVIAKKFFDLREQLTVGPNGLRWRPWSDDLIPWSEIIDVTIWSHRRQKFIVLYLDDATRFRGEDS